jgi:hypothetical protein
MGEGEGKQDVSDQIEDEEQLLGLKSNHSTWGMRLSDYLVVLQMRLARRVRRRTHKSSLRSRKARRWPRFADCLGTRPGLFRFCRISMASITMCLTRRTRRTRTRRFIQSPILGWSSDYLVFVLMQSDEEPPEDLDKEMGELGDNKVTL